MKGGIRKMFIKMSTAVVPHRRYTTRRGIQRGSCLERGNCEMIGRREIFGYLSIYK